LKDWQSLVRVETGDLEDELDRLSRPVIATFGPDAYEAAVIRANVSGRPTPNNPRAMNLALRDELKRMLGPH
jgi:hypothetical protein